MKLYNYRDCTIIEIENRLVVVKGWESGWQKRSGYDYKIQHKGSMWSCKYFVSWCVNVNIIIVILSYHFFSTGKNWIKDMKTKNKLIKKKIKGQNRERSNLNLFFLILVTAHVSTLTTIKIFKKYFSIPVCLFLKTFRFFGLVFYFTKPTD